MDNSHVKEQLPRLSRDLPLQVQGRQIKVYVEDLDKNFYLTNPSGKRLSLAVQVSLTHRGVTIGWKTGAELWPHDVHFLEIGCLRLIHSPR